MPPKRKRAEETADEAAAPATRPTRISARTKAKAEATAAQEQLAVQEEAPTEPATKRKKPAATTAASKKAPASKTTTKKGAKSTDDAEPAKGKQAAVAPAATAAATSAATAKSKATGSASKKANDAAPPVPATNGSQESFNSTAAPNGLNTTTTTTTTSSSSSSASTKSVPQPTAARAPTPPPSAPAVPPTQAKMQPYTAQRALALFQKYRDEESGEPGWIGPEGFTELCSETGVPLEGALPLILAWQLETKEMAKISKEEWVRGMDKLKIASLPALATALNDLQNLLILGQGTVPAKKGKKDQDVYDKTVYMTYAADTKAAFRKLYTYCFTLAKPEGSRNIDMETSCAFWSVLLAPQFPIMKDVLEFIAEKGTYKATNKDLWGMMLEFCQTVSPSLKDYGDDEAWPTLLDDFVSWRKEKLALGPSE